MDRLISEQAIINILMDNDLDHIQTKDGTELIQLVQGIQSADLDLKQSFKDGYGTALNVLEDRFEALLNNNPWYANAISDILQIINEQKGSD